MRARGTPGSRWTHGPQSLAASRRPGRVPGEWAFRPVLPAYRRQRRKSAVTFGVPRAVFEACSVWPPVDRLFRRRPLFPFLGVQRLSTAVGIGRCERSRTPRTHPPSYPVARSRRAGTARLGPPRRMVRATRHGHRTNLTGLPRSGPADRGGASPPPPLRPSPRSSALERALVGTGRSFLIFL